MSNKDEIKSIPIVDIMTTAEVRIERKLAVCLALHPREVIKKSNGFHPEVDQIVCKYWNAVMKKRNEITQVSYEKAFEISMGLIYPKHAQNFWKWWDVLADENSFATIDKTLKDIRGLRTIRKTVDYIQVNRIIEETLQGV